MNNVISTDRTAKWDMKTVREQWRMLIERGCSVFKNDKYLSAILFCFTPPRDMLALPIPTQDSEMKDLILDSFIRPMVSNNNAIATFFAAQVKMITGIETLPDISMFGEPEMKDPEKANTLLFVGQIRTDTGVETYMSTIKIQDGMLGEDRPDMAPIEEIGGQVSTFLRPIGPVVRV
jgi:hypothetical protein